jgi:hypothetical protein
VAGSSSACSHSRPFVPALDAVAQPPSFVAFESGPVRPLALTPDGGTLVVANTPDDQVELFAVSPAGLRFMASVPVGLEPVAVAARTNTERGPALVAGPQPDATLSARTPAPGGSPR